MAEGNICEGDGMKLTDCTKSELIWVIEQAGKLSLGDTEYYINRALNDLQFQRGMERIEKAEKLTEISRKATEEYVQLLKPYERKAISEVPLDVLRKADLALKRSKEANEKYCRLMRIK